MAGAWLVSTREFAQQSTTDSRVVTSRAAHVCDPDCICCNKEEEWVITVDSSIACIPDRKPFTLEGGEVVDAGEEE